MIGLLVIAALCPQLVRTSQPVEGWNPPRGWTLGISGALWAVILYGIVLLAFGILPPFPPALAIITGLLLAIGAIFLVPKWSAGNRWTQIHTFSLIAGVITGSMLAGFIGFIGAATADLYFKIIINLVAIISLFLLGKWIINTTNQYG